MQSPLQGFFPNLGENPLILFLPRPGCGKSLKPVLWMFMESSICKTYVFVSFFFIYSFLFQLQPYLQSHILLPKIKLKYYGLYRN